MKCYKHNNIDAVSQCAACGRGLCGECSDLYNPPHCQSCFEQLTKNVVAERKKRLITTVIIAVIGFFAGVSTGEILGGLAGAYMALSVYWGWAYVKPMLWVWFGSILIWGAMGYLIASMLLACAIGIGAVIGPFLLIKDIYEYVRDKNFADEVNQIGQYRNGE